MSLKFDGVTKVLVSAAMLGSVVSLAGALLSAKQTSDLNGLAKTRDVLLETLKTDDLASIKKQVAELQERSRRIEARPSSSLPVPTDLADLSSRVDAVTARQTRLENTLTKQPLKALEIPILRRDLDSQSKDIAALTTSLQRAQEAQWDTMKWLIGGLGAAIAAILVPFVSRLIASNRESSE